MHSRVKRNRPIFNKLILTTGFIFFLYANAFCAQFSISAQPYEGGYDLRFDKVFPGVDRVNREVNLSISTDLAKQYQVVESLLEPLSSSDGKTIPLNNFIVYGIRGTNKYGTLNVEQEIPVASGRQIVYTSNQAGDADSFILVFGILTSGLEPGSYRGRISFSLESIGSNENPVITILNIFAEVEVDSSVEIKSASGLKDVLLKYEPQEARASDVLVNIKGGFGKQFRILQLVSEQPVSLEGELLDYDVVNFVGKDAKKGMVVSEPTPLSSKQEVIYTSSLSGESDDFLITYSLGQDLTKIKSGDYRATIRYFLEGPDSNQIRLIDTLRLEIENPRIFDLVVTPKSGGLIQFRDIKPMQPPQKSEIELEIKSNIGKKYQLTQKAISPLTNQDGYAIPEKNFTVQTESEETKGELKVVDKSSVKIGDTVLFLSDPKGSSDKFKIIYELSLPADYRAGDYSTRIIYSLSEI